MNCVKVLNPFATSWKRYINKQISAFVTTRQFSYDFFFFRKWLNSYKWLTRAIILVVSLAFRRGARRHTFGFPFWQFLNMTVTRHKSFKLETNRFLVNWTENKIMTSRARSEIVYLVSRISCRPFSVSYLLIVYHI